MEEVRDNEIVLILGRRKSGKTFYIRNFIKKYKEAHPEQKILIIDTFKSHKYSDIAAIPPESISRWRKPNIYRSYTAKMEEITEPLQKLHNALVIFEDASKYFKFLPPSVESYIIDTKQKNVDILFAYHGFSVCPKRLFNYCDKIVLMKTNDSPKSREKSDIPNFELVWETYLKVKESKDLFVRAHINIF